MYQTASGGRSVVVITVRDNREPLRSLIQQVGRLGYQTHLVSRLGYEQTRHVATPQVVLVDIAYPYQDATAMTTNIRAIWEYVPIVLLLGANEFERLPYEVDVHGFLTLHPLCYPSLMPACALRNGKPNWRTPRAMCCQLMRSL